MWNSIGATVWARKTIESDVFFNKPDNWFKIWFFIITRANHEDNNNFKRGEAFTSYEEISRYTHSTKNQIDHFMRWAKGVQMLATRKATRGFYITLINYQKYQDFETYRSDTKGEREAIKKRQKSDTINNNVNNENNVNNKTRADKPLKDKFETNKYPKADYANILNLYQKLKGIELKGDEFLPPMAEIKRMFKSGRTVEQINNTMEICEDNYEDWAMSTVKMKIADVVGGKLFSKNKAKNQGMIIKESINI